MLAMTLHGMQGTPYIYQGKEISMTNPRFYPHHRLSRRGKAITCLPRYAPRARSL
ncbi:Trehalose-6-phosphate hydrolase [Salmonella enterica subsp. arizonae]|uniref:Trehalose-6-phosphate hydrolase n=1 Tax=Salmonella enterica subsp. arizonae TaxID=59203 RepID=A0A2X4TJB4_SALER|nr:Trehalose-6-phosphate hydrolase [Salmonella enterica subsp. arizonae]